MKHPDKIIPITAGARRSTNNESSGQKEIDKVYLAKTSNDQRCLWLASCWLISRINELDRKLLANLSLENPKLYNNLYLRRGNRHGITSFGTVKLFQKQCMIDRKYMLCKVKAVEQPSLYLNYVLSDDM